MRVIGDAWTYEPYERFDVLMPDAQQESQSLSQNVKLGLQYRYQQGKVQVNHNRFMGYTKDEEGNLIIVPEEAEIIKRIYREYLEGKSLVPCNI